jgi:hypothetical protein
MIVGISQQDNRIKMIMVGMSHQDDAQQEDGRNITAR